MKMDPDSFRWCPVPVQESLSANCKRRGSPQTWKTTSVLCCVGGWALAEVVQRGCVASIPGNLLKSLGHGPGHFGRENHLHDSIFFFSSFLTLHFPVYFVSVVYGEPAFTLPFQRHSLILDSCPVSANLIALMKRLTEHEARRKSSLSQLYLICYEIS